MNQIQGLQNVKPDVGIKMLYRAINRIQSDPYTDHKYQFLSSLPKIFATILGFEGKKGWLDILYEQVIKNDGKSRMKVQKAMRVLINMLIPGTKYSIWQILVDNQFPIQYDVIFIYQRKNLPSQIRQSIEAKTFNNNVISQFKKSFAKNQDLLNKNNGNLSLRSEEWYFILLICKVKQFSSISHRRSKFQQDYYCDYFYQDLIKNPYLIIIRKVMQHLIQKRQKQFKKLIYYIKQFIIQELQFLNNSHQVLYRKSKIQVERIKRDYLKVPKPTAILTIYLAIIHIRNYKRKSFHFNNKEENYQFFFQAAQKMIKTSLEIWSSPQNNLTALGDLGRLWLLLIRHHDEIQRNVVEQANKYDFNFKQDLIQELLNNKISFQYRQNKLVKNYSYELLQREPKPTHIDLFPKFIQILSTCKQLPSPIDVIFLINSHSIIDPPQMNNELYSTLLGKLQSIYYYMNSSKQLKYTTIPQEMKSMIDYFSSVWRVQKGLPMLKKPVQGVICNKGRIDYESWKSPMKSFQNPITFFLLYWMSLTIDRARGINQESPQNNLRFLCTNKIFLSLLLISLIIYYKLYY